ncbi:fatty acid hydroxylase family protein, partial [Bacillus sp. JJ722]
MKQRLYSDFFLHFDIAFMLVLNIIIVARSIFWNFTLMLIIIYLIGMATFIISEYFIHRFFFHLKAPKNPFFLRILKRLH